MIKDYGSKHMKNEYIANFIIFLVSNYFFINFYLIYERMLIILYILIFFFINQLKCSAPLDYNIRKIIVVMFSKYAINCLLNEIILFWFCE